MPMVDGDMYNVATGAVVVTCWAPALVTDTPGSASPLVAPAPSPLTMRACSPAAPAAAQASAASAHVFFMVVSPRRSAAVCGATPITRWRGDRPWGVSD